MSNLARWCDTHTLYEFFQLMDEHKQNQEKEYTMTEYTSDEGDALFVREQAELKIVEDAPSITPQEGDGIISTETGGNSTFIQVAEDIGDETIVVA